MVLEKEMVKQGLPRAPLCPWTQIGLHRLSKTFKLPLLKITQNDGTNAFWLPRQNIIISHKTQNRSISKYLQPGTVDKIICYQKLLHFRLFISVSLWSHPLLPQHPSAPLSPPGSSTLTATSLTPTKIKTKA